jgi:hypothetical protein
MIEERGKSTLKENNPLLFEIWIFRNCQPVRDYDCIIIVAIESSTLKIIVLQWSDMFTRELLFQ